MIATYFAGSIPNSSVPKRHTLTAAYTPAATGSYELDIYNYRNASITSCDNYIDNIEIKPATEDFKLLQKYISIANGGSIYMQIKATWQHKQEPYIVLAASGIDQGFWMDGIQVRLNYDSIFQYSLDNVNKMPFQKTFGFLDGSGMATASFHMPGPVSPGLLGKCFFFEYLLLTGNGTRPLTYASNPVMFQFIP